VILLVALSKPLRVCVRFVPSGVIAIPFWVLPTGIEVVTVFVVALMTTTVLLPRLAT
jgi:hypothetical protein